MMKLLTLFWSVYIFAMAILPCHDSSIYEDFCCHEKKETHQKDKHENHTCTPFCVCVCCGSLVVLGQEFVSPAPVFAVSEMVSIKVLLKHYFVSNYFGFIWQPPKL
jgi:hypothetical protein